MNSISASALKLRTLRFGTRVKQEQVFFFYSLTALLLQASMMLAAFVVLRYVPPDKMGVWRTLLLFQTYSNVVTLGIPNGLSRELPFFLGRGNRPQTERLAATAQFYILLISGIGSVVLIMTVAVAPGLSSQWTLALLAMSALWFSRLYRSYLSVTFRAEAEFRRLTVCNIIEFVLNLGSLVLVAVGGYTGMVARYALLSVMMAVLLHFIRPIHVRPRFVRRDFSILLKTGIPQYFGSYLIAASLAFEQTILARRGGTELVGLYAPAAAITTVMMAVHASIVSYINPRIVFKLGQTNDPRAVFRGTRIATYVITAISLPIAIAGMVMLPLAMPAVFPKYKAALHASQFALAGGFFLAINTTLTGIYALKEWGYVAVYAISAIVLRWMLPWLLVKSGGDPLTRVAFGGAVANLLVFFIGMAIVWIVAKSTTYATNEESAMDVS
jgi:O-antigen/teichoic acid export membrane protein